MDGTQLTLCDVTPLQVGRTEIEIIRLCAREIAQDMAYMLQRERRTRHGQRLWGKISIKRIGNHYGLSVKGYSPLDRIGGLVVLSSMGCPRDNHEDMAYRCIMNYLESAQLDPARKGN